jgi:hypothetical protein
MLQGRVKILLIASLIAVLIIPTTYLSTVSSSSGSIKINTTGSSTPGQQVQAGGNMNLYLGGVTWTGQQFYLFMGADSSTQMGSGLVYTPLINVYDVSRTTATSTYFGDYGTWTVGSGWVNGSIPYNQAVGNYYIKAVDSSVSSSVAVSDTYITVIASTFNSTLNVSPPQGTGGTPITFTGSGWPGGSTVQIFYQDPNYGWKMLSSTQANAQGYISYTCEAPDMKKSVTNYDSYECYTAIAFKAQTPSGLVYSGTTYFNEYQRGLITVGTASASGLYGNGTDLSSTVRVKTGDSITVSGRWFHANSPVYIRWDGKQVVGTVTHDQWASTVPIGQTATNANGYFATTVTIPEANAGVHYLQVEDSQTWIVVKVYLSIGSLTISPVSGPGGATVQFIGSAYPASSNVDLYYYDSSFATWKYWTSTTSTPTGTIQFSTEIPDLKTTSYSGEYNNYSTTLSFRTDVNGVSYAYADYTQFARGLTQVGSRVAYNLFGNGTNLASSVNVRPGDSLYIAGKYFHPGIIYIKFDGDASTGDSYVASQWTSSINVGSTTASQTGSFGIYVTVPTVDGGQHSVAVEDSQTSLVFGLKVTAPTPTPTPPPTASPTTSPTTSPTINPTPTPTPKPNLPTPIIDLTCKGQITDSGSRVQMNGQVTLNGNTISNTAVSIAYSIDNGGSWRDLTMVTTESDGTYSVDWRPDVSGYYLIRATCDETLAMNSASKTVSLALTRDEEQHSVFTVNSNSTITQFAFDSTSGKLSFVATGPSGSTGYVEIYIPKSILSDISKLSATIDGHETTFDSENQADAWLITFSYTHSSHTIIMSIGDDMKAPVSGGDNSQILLYVVVPLVVIVVVAFAAIGLLKRRK